MMVALHMLLFVPLAASVGFAVCAVFVGAKMNAEED